MVTIKQEVPPPGGYGPIDWTKKTTKRIPGFASFAFVIGTTAIGFYYWKRFQRPREMKVQREMNDSRIALTPLLQAEWDRILLKQKRANRAWVSFKNPKNRQANSVDLDETVCYKPSHLDRHCLQSLLKQMRANRDEEAELMKDYPDWKVGTLFGNPVYHNPREEFHMPNNDELYAHADQRRRIDRIFEKLWH